MNNLNITKSFIFNKAEYRMKDDNGNELILKINYAGGKYNVEKIMIGKKGMRRLVGEARLIAFDLLSRKSNNNRIGALQGKE